MIPKPFYMGPWTTGWQNCRICNDCDSPRPVTMLGPKHCPRCTSDDSRKGFARRERVETSWWRELLFGVTIKLKTREDSR